VGANYWLKKKPVAPTVQFGLEEKKNAEQFERRGPKQIEVYSLTGNKVLLGGVKKGTGRVMVSMLGGLSQAQ